MNLVKIIYLPIELSARELEAKVLLATHLLQRGFNVVIGQQWELYNQIPFLPPGVFLFKSHNKLHQSAMKVAKKFNFFVSALEEETLSGCSDRNIEKNSSIDLYSICDLILTPGEFEKSFHVKKSNKNNISIVGNPRADILKKKYHNIFKEKILAIKNQYKKFCLINTNFGLANAFMGNLEEMKSISIASGGIDLNNKRSIEDFDFLFAWEMKNSILIKELVIELSKEYSNINFVVRPHPAELIDKVINTYKDFSNVFVIRDGSHIPWTLASDILIHTSCTTGFESFLAGHHAVSLVYEKNWYTDSILSNRVNKVFDSNKKLKKYLRDYFTQTPSELRFKPLGLSELEYYVANTGAESSVKKIVSTFENITFKYSSFKFSIGPILERQDFHKLKCTIQSQEIEKLINDFCEIEGEDFLKIKPKIQMLADSLFLLSP